MGKKLTWHGHANFQVQCTCASENLNLLFDPFFTGNPKAAVKADAIARPDIVLVSHSHGDHMGDAADICKRTGALLAIPVGVADTYTKAGVAGAQILNGHGFNIGGTMEAKGVSITMTQAFHTTNDVPPVGYIVRLPDGYTIYHAGDTGIFGGMELLGQLYAIDLALLPTGSVYTMDMRQAALAAKLLRAKTVIPMHWGTFPALAQSMDAFPGMVEQVGSRCVVMQPGETIDLCA